MKLRVLPYVTVEVDDRLRRRMRRAGERWRLNMRAYLLSAADDVDTAVEGAGDRVRGLCDRAVHRIDSVAATVTDKIGPDVARKEQPEPQERPRLRVVKDERAS